MHIYRDAQCSKDITANNFLTFKLIPDNTTLGNGSGNRTFRVGMIVDEKTIAGSKIISWVDGKIVVAFCLQFALWNPASPTAPENLVDTAVAVAVELTNSTGIVALVQEGAEYYGVDVYRCNATNQELTVQNPVTQGEVVRLCVKPNNITHNDGVYLRSIDSFQWTQGNLIQQTLNTGQKLGDNGLSSVTCNAGSAVCVIETTFKNDFFSNPGTAFGSGTVFLQFGGASGNRRLRTLIETGAFVGSSAFNITVDVTPSNETFSAEAYECDSVDQPVNRTSPLSIGESIRVCVRPSQMAQKAGVYMRSFKSWSFGGRGISQTAIDDNGKAADQTLALCFPGQLICSFKTVLSTAFFLRDGTIHVSGEALLQFGTEASNATRRAMLVGRRRTGADPGYAGSSQSNFDFGVQFSPLALQGPIDIWKSSSAGLKVLYLAALIISSLIICCCVCGCGYFLHKQSKGEQLFPITEEKMRTPNDSIDAFKDSKADYYSDDEFNTDSSEEMSSSEEDSFAEIAESLPTLPPPLGAQRNGTGNPPHVGLSSSMHEPNRPGGRRASNLSHSMHEPRQTHPSLQGARAGPYRQNPNMLVDQPASRPEQGMPRRVSGGLPPSSSMHGPRRLSDGPPPNGLSSSMHDPRRVAGGPYPNSSTPPLHGPRSGGQGPPPNGLSSSSHDPRRQSVNRQAPNRSQSLNAGRNPPIYDAGPRRDRLHPNGMTSVPRRPQGSSAVVNRQDRTKALPPASTGTRQPQRLSQASASSAANESLGSEASNGAGARSSMTKQPDAKTKVAAKKSTQRRPMDAGDASAEVASEKELIEESNEVELRSTSSDDSDESKALPDDDDVCFDADDHPGTQAFLAAVKKSLKKHRDEEFSPKVYRAIKKQLPNRRFFICDDEDHPDLWREVNKSELINLFWKFFDEEKAKLN